MKILKNIKVDSLIHEVAVSKPLDVAIYSENKNFTYEEINNKARQLANYINQYSYIGKNIAVYMERCVDSIVCILAIMRADKTYIPIDYEVEPKQFEYIIEDCQPTIVFTTVKLKNRIEKITKSTKF